MLKLLVPSFAWAPSEALEIILYTLFKEEPQIVQASSLTKPGFVSPDNISIISELAKFEKFDKTMATFLHSTEILELFEFNKCLDLHLLTLNYLLLS